MFLRQNLTLEKSRNVFRKSEKKLGSTNQNHKTSSLFKVITTQGNNNVTTNGSTTPIVSGTRLNSGSSITVAENSYLGLIHISGKTLEVKQPGTYEVEQLAKQFSTGQS